MAYIALYREWRPRTFADIVGQPHITRTLHNALEKERVAHAYLFSGPRGTGKTSTAKVLAKALNCLEPAGVEPCNRCDLCSSINEGSAMDVIEIDAASNRGIDEIRELREKVKFAPAQGKFKVYIVDEVHMLTAEAFNALLKTLEEPPGHVIFILATTEPHKIPATIHSRCQRFDFHRITQQDTVERLAKIAAAAGIEADGAALELIARTAEGGLRDAVSTLDQCSSFGGGRITVEEVESILGMAGGEILAGFGEAMLDGNVEQSLSLVQECAGRGKDYRRLALDLINFLRDLLVHKVCPGTTQGPGGDSFATLAAKADKTKLIRAIDILSETERDMKWATQPRILLEVALIKSCAGEMAGVVREAEKNAGRERAAEKSAPPKGAATAAGSSAGRGVHAARGEAAAEPRPEPGPASRPAAAAETAAAAEAAPAAPAAAQVGPAAHAAPEGPAGSDEGLLALVREKWPEVLEQVKAVRPAVYAFLVEGAPLEAGGNKLVIGFKKKYSFHKQRIEEQENRRIVEEALRKVAQRSLSISCALYQPEKKPAAPEPVKDTFYEVMELFGGQEVQLKDD